ncbi:unnamed protein product [Phytophthora fragariaefolia]|uniref:Unnamed protein product n=1 Tax=Phytophthora fragariaefolia TaxID=1490495 RepID=A0A9W6TKC6_9STRA|nr:unnamed protein product [Phytophthora fragariaefolia]
MARARSMKDGGRGDRGRGEATRQSRRAQGLPVESHKDLDVINREARARRKAERDAKAAEDKAKSTESAAQDNQVSTRQCGCAPGGGSSFGLSAAEQEVETVEDTPVKIKAEVIVIEESDAVVRSALEGADASSRSPQNASTQVSSSSQGQVLEPEVLPRSDASIPVSAPQSLNADLRPSSSVGAGTAQLDETAAKKFVARQVYCWEQMRSGRVVRPSVEYAWPNPRPDFSAWQEATMATSDYLRRRMALEDRDAAWIAELRP